MPQRAKKAAPSPSALALLQELQERVTHLWKEMGRASSHARRLALQRKYEEAVELYRRQKLILGVHEDSEEAPGASQETGASTSSFRSFSRGPQPGAIYKLPASDRPDPYIYLDYREFLVAWFKRLKIGQGISLREFAKQAGLDPVALVRALRRWAPLGHADFMRALGLLEIDNSDREFLDALHCLSDTESPAIRSAALKRLLNFSRFRQLHANECEAWRYLSHGYTVAIREMCNLPGFRAQPEWIRKRLRMPVDTAEIRRALKFLQLGGFIELLPNGAARGAEKQISCDGGLYRLSLAQFHRQMLEYAAQAIHAVPSSQRLLLGQTLALPASQTDRARQILEEALQKIRELPSAAALSERDEVYHVELVLVPLTRNSGSTEGSD